MTTLDWTLIAVYLLSMIALSVRLNNGQQTAEDYFLGGRNLPWWAIGLSIMATQSSAISFISIPAFVALRPDGGLSWIHAELAVPLAMVALMLTLLPLFRRLSLISIYQYLEMRYNRSVSLLVSLIFLISRGLATGIGVYATAIVLSVCTGLPVWQMVLLVGAITVIYDCLGVWRDNRNHRTYSLRAADKPWSGSYQ